MKTTKKPSKIEKLKKEWLSEICPNGDIINYTELLDDDKGSDKLAYPVRYKFNIYTDTYKYNIYCVDNKEGGYLGCVMSRRKPNAGEDWTRGRDLPDGKFNRKTWERIKNAIIQIELVKI